MKWDERVHRRQLVNGRYLTASWLAALVRRSIDAIAETLSLLLLKHTCLLSWDHFLTHSPSPKHLDDGRYWEASCVSIESIASSLTGKRLKNANLLCRKITSECKFALMRSRLVVVGLAKSIELAWNGGISAEMHESVNGAVRHHLGLGNPCTHLLHSFVGLMRRTFI